MEGVGNQGARHLRRNSDSHALPEIPTSNLQTGEHGIPHGKRDFEEGLGQRCGGGAVAWGPRLGSRSSQGPSKTVVGGSGRDHVTAEAAGRAGVPSGGRAVGSLWEPDTARTRQGRVLPWGLWKEGLRHLSSLAPSARGRLRPPPGLQEKRADGVLSPCALGRFPASTEPRAQPWMRGRPGAAALEGVGPAREVCHSTSPTSEYATGAAVPSENWARGDGVPKSLLRPEAWRGDKSLVPSLRLELRTFRL